MSVPTVQFKKISLADRVFEKLESDILLGVYAPGTVLTEVKLAEALGVSRTPAHEALRRLELERLIVDTGKGYQVVGITRRDVQDVMDIRLGVEGLAAYYAAENRTEEGLQALREIVELQEFYIQNKDPEHIRQMDDEFHATICRLCGHQVIADMLNPLHKKIQNYRRASFSDQTRTNSIAAEHRAIYEAIAAGNTVRARAEMEQHVRNGKESMLEKEMG